MAILEKYIAGGLGMTCHYWWVMANLEVQDIDVTMSPYAELWHCIPSQIRT